MDEIPIEGPLQSCAPPQLADVACVLDGDTFDIGACGETLGERIRMLGVDAPEIAHAPEPADCHGDAAFNAAVELLGTRRVTLTFDNTCIGIYGRTLAYVWLEGADLDDVRDLPGVEDLIDTSGGATADTDEPTDEPTDERLLVNEWLIAQGHAIRFEEDFGEGPLRYEGALRSAEASAEANARGLWTECGNATAAAAPPNAVWEERPLVRGPKHPSNTESR